MHRSTCRAIVALLLGCGALVAPQEVIRAAESSAASTSQEARADAIRNIPFQRIAPEYRRSIRNVLDDTSVYRRLPTVTIDCYPPLFTFMAQNPEVLVQIWRQLGISNVDMVRTGDNTFRLSDNVGTVGHMTIVDQQCDDQAQNRIVMVADGAYEGKPFKNPVTADCVLLLRSGSVKETNGRQYVAARLDTFVRIDRASLELFAKVVHPLVGKTADRNFADTIHFIGNMSLASATRPATIERLTNSLPQVSPTRKSQLVGITYACGEHAPELKEARLARAAE
jgi:hypothetical protein